MPAPSAHNEPKLITHVPAKRWEGYYSVLVGFKIGGKELVGKFLVDSGAPQSMISPTFLSNQGAFASWIEIPKAKAQRITWSGGSGVAVPAIIGEVKLGGVALPIHDFMIHDVDLFGSPESFSTCCDGILGSDFLRHYVVEFKPGKTAELNLYAREGYDRLDRFPLVEVSFNKNQDLVSDCTATAKGSNTQVRGLRWQTGSESALEFSHHSNAERGVQRWNLGCGPVTIAKNVSVSKKEQGASESVAMDAGMELLGRDQIIFDLEHGWIWFESSRIGFADRAKSIGPQLRIHFSGRGSIAEGSRHESRISSRGAQQSRSDDGGTILSLDSKSADGMDSWEVEQRLSGVYGTQVDIEWKTGKKTSKLAPLTVPPIAPSM